MTPEERLIVALDAPGPSQALALVERLGDGVRFFKVAVGLFTSAGPGLIGELKRRQKRVFLDLKFHDIPTQVALACRAAVQLGADMINLHTLGGEEMMKAAMAAVREESKKLGRTPPVVVGVTVLTSLGTLDGIREPGSRADEDMAEAVIDLARRARDAGLDGVVCSGGEVRRVKAAAGVDFVTVVPGIRPAGEEAGDQRRVFTPGRAVAEGADYLVVGRPITAHQDPVAAVERILEEIKHGSAV